jgi:tRNA threonylcarbamoyladenosine biosynthesis protein TsaB
MALILLLETATEVCSVAISRDGIPIACQETKEGFLHSEKLTVFIEQLLNENQIITGELDAVCISRGPGSYTGLRIGTSVAKGICYRLDRPLIAISTLDSMASYAGSIYNPGNEQFLLCPMLDARRMEVYTALYSRGERLTGIEAKIIDSNTFSSELEEQRILFFGNGAEKCKQVLQHRNAVFMDDIHASARFMSAMAEREYNSGKFEDVAYFEPFYLKDFIATVPKNKFF